jgi:dTDP-3-amino-3,4,6-trideoxy-alpha-D-glucose transaminase
VVTHPRAEELVEPLRRLGIQSRGYYRTPLHRQPAMAPYVSAGLELPFTDELAATNLALPMSPALSDENAQSVAAAVAQAAQDFTETT